MGANNKWRGLNLCKQLKAQLHLDLCPVSFVSYELCYIIIYTVTSIPTKCYFAMYLCTVYLNGSQCNVATLYHKHTWINYCLSENDTVGFEFTEVSGFNLEQQSWCSTYSIYLFIFIYNWIDSAKLEQSVWLQN